MSLVSFVQSLTHTLGKNEVAKSCELSLKALTTTTIPAYKSAEALFRVAKLASTDAQSYQNRVRRAVKANGTGMFEIILECLHNAESILRGIEKRSDTLFADKEATIAITYQKATYIRLVSAIGFGTEYARRFLNHVYILETAKISPDFKLEEHSTPAERAYVEDNFENFCTVLRSLEKRYTEIEKDVDGMPEAIVNDLSEQTLPHTLGATRTDPLGMNNFILPGDVSARWNPFYLIGTMIATFQVKQYNVAKEELDLLQMRMLNLQKKQEGKPDPKLEAQIEHMANRIGTLRYEIEVMEERYGI